MTLKTVATTQVAAAGTQTTQGKALAGGKGIVQQHTVFGTKVLQKATATRQPVVIGQLGKLLLTHSIYPASMYNNWVYPCCFFVLI